MHVVFSDISAIHGSCVWFSPPAEERLCDHFHYERGLRHVCRGLSLLKSGGVS